jgi:aspartate-semialdehyde dehydrogenase
MKVAVVGATGLVGTMMLRVLEERNFPVGELLPVASEKSAGKKIMFRGKEHLVLNMNEALSKQPDIALFSAGGSTSLEWAPVFAKQRCVVVDNSSAWRMDPKIKLVVPEINADVIGKDDYIIANPNCSTIQMVMVLNPLHKKFKIKRIVVSTYQSVTGTGVKAVTQLENERKGISGEMAYRYPIDKNAIPQIDVFLENGYTKEEMKMVNETRKILRDESIGVSATCVRIPVIGGHSESVNVSFERAADPTEIRKILCETEGVILDDKPEEGIYPMPLYSNGKDEVFVGRIRSDDSEPNTINMWIVADNLRKGAATNAVQIAEYLLRRGLIGHRDA